MSDRKKAHVLSSFNDIGTGQSFEEGATPLLDAGTFANYEHAGLVSAHEPKAAPHKHNRSAKKPAQPTATAPETPPASETAPDA